MDKIKLTTSNYESIILQMLEDANSARTNIYYFSSTEINESTIRQAAWDNNIVLKFAPVDSFISTCTYSQILN